MGEDLQVSIAHRLETQLSQFPTNPARSFARLPEAVRAELDLIRQYYVAYSRAQWALILVGTNQQLARGRISVRSKSQLATQQSVAALKVLE